MFAPSTQSPAAAAAALRHINTNIPPAQLFIPVVAHPEQQQRREAPLGFLGSPKPVSTVDSLLAETKKECVQLKDQLYFARSELVRYAQEIENQKGIAAKRNLEKGDLERAKRSLSRDVAELIDEVHTLKVDKKKAIDHVRYLWKSEFERFEKALRAETAALRVAEKSRRVSDDQSRVAMAHYDKAKRDLLELQRDLNDYKVSTEEKLTAAAVDRNSLTSRLRDALARGEKEEGEVTDKAPVLHVGTQTDPVAADSLDMKDNKSQPPPVQRGEISTQTEPVAEAASTSASSHPPGEGLPAIVVSAEAGTQTEAPAAASVVVATKAPKRKTNPANKGKRQKAELAGLDNVNYEGHKKTKL